MARAIERTTSCSCWRPLLERPTALAHNSKREREKISRSSLARDILVDHGRSRARWRAGAAHRDETRRDGRMDGELGMDDSKERRSVRAYLGGRIDVEDLGAHDGDRHRNMLEQELLL